MNRVALVVFGAVLVAATSVSAQGVPYKKLLERYETLDAGDIVWGNEIDDERRVGIMDPPYFTPNPDQVQVVEFVRYTDGTWKRSEPFTSAWRTSLPKGVEVVRIPKATSSTTAQLYWDHWPIHQRVYFAGLMLGREAEVHKAIMDKNRLGRRPRLGSEREVAEVVLQLGIEPKTFEQWYHHPEVAWLTHMANGLDRDRVWALVNRGLESGRVALYPEFLINGKYVVDTSFIRHPAKAYRIANRLIRRELEAGRAHDGPTNDTEFAEWMASRSGEIYKRAWLGRDPKWYSVYSHARREIWSLGEEGEVQRIHRLFGDGDDSFFEYVDKQGNKARAHLWRIGLQFLSFEGEHGPQRYGAFLLTDYLSAPDTHWVSLAFKGRDVAMAFSSDGKVEARNDKGALFGSWWLEAGDLSVSFGELGTQSWPWQEVAERVGFDVPHRSLTPWLIEEGHDSGEEAKNRSAAAKSLSSGGIDSRGR